MKALMHGPTWWFFWNGTSKNRQLCDDIQNSSKVPYYHFSLQYCKCFLFLVRLRQGVSKEYVYIYCIMNKDLQSCYIAWSFDATLPHCSQGGYYFSSLDGSFVLWVNDVKQIGYICTECSWGGYCWTVGIDLVKEEGLI